MYEYEIVNKLTGETTFAWGGNYTDAMKRGNHNPNEWDCVYCEKVED